MSLTAHTGSLYRAVADARQASEALDKSFGLNGDSGETAHLRELQTALARLYDQGHELVELTGAGKP